MSFRQRLMLFTALAIAVTVAGASLAVWMVAKHELYAQVNQSLGAQATLAAVSGHDQGPFGGPIVYNRLAPDGDVIHNTLAVPITSRQKQVASGGASSYFTDMHIRGYHVRVYVAQLRPDPGIGAGGAIVVATSLDGTDHALRRIQFWILLVGGIAIALAAGLAALVATAALRPVRRLTTAAENVTATGDLSERVEVTGHDELGRLATRFNAMLAALEESVGRQRRLVADASHELRTPLTSTRTNIDLLREGRLPPEEAKHALDEAAVELAALTTLVSDLVELARGEERKLRVEEVQLDDLVAGAVERAKARAPEATFVTSLSPTVVQADPVLLERAVLNLLDNAVKYSPAGAPIEVTVRDGEVVVADHGPGVAEEDAARIFDRFYRSAAARSKPGAGLGLAIVREAARAHGGDATVESSASGSKFRLTLPAAV